MAGVLFEICIVCVSVFVLPELTGLDAFAVDTDGFLRGLVVCCLSVWFVVLVC
jgi:hypothetical protein